MPPKKAKSVASVKDKNGAAATTAAAEDLNKALEAELLTLEIQLQEKDDQLTETLKRENLHTEKCKQCEEDLEAEERRRLAICADLVRRHKALQLDYTNQIGAMEATLQGYKREYAEQMTLLRQLGAAKDKEVAEHDARVKALKVKMDRVSEEFARLLMEIQEVMAERVKSPLLEAADETQRFSEVLEASKGQYFKKLGEIIRDREEKYPLGSGWRGAGMKAPKAVRSLGVS
ncbi:hypothetical protein NCLIV_009430 [Neospora caninum Liverpool]|uniref:Dynein regulatory complex protein 12 n=1 Tax=Neospora caninum (strain Liverpool) TaxID=572307 RepID=F0V9P7_NEOCL|nr:hypothetical protein NCLIV_009430 [Neospora caninum Liverpool]CBZ50473.1 hypothetical protein NCLIV_009430 [Neospora caninum Liverpool]CEL65083.1 TPA: hypothetical protein BN1204_009430 [Neospora caninum Liverpool]|eukprot:XP_003880506.1 hypothetical protein NCLIV_009430 [Neospora caninum Liverpool]